jgi:hypothetical protein
VLRLPRRRAAGPPAPLVSRPRLVTLRAVRRRVGDCASCRRDMHFPNIFRRDHAITSLESLSPLGALGSGALLAKLDAAPTASCPSPRRRASALAGPGRAMARGGVSGARTRRSRWARQGGPCLCEFCGAGRRPDDGIECLAARDSDSARGTLRCQPESRSEACGEVRVQRLRV